MYAGIYASLVSASCLVTVELGIRVRSASDWYIKLSVSLMETASTRKPHQCRTSLENSACLSCVLLATLACSGRVNIINDNFRDIAGH